MARFLGELRRRRVIRVAVVYAAAGWLTIEVAATVLPPLDALTWSVKAVIILVILGLPIAIVIAWIFDLGPHGLHRTDAAADPAPSIASTSAHDRALAPDQPARRRAHEEYGQPSIAVLPFVNMSGDAENEYFSDGISEEILNLLAKLPQLRVSSRTSSSCFKGKDLDIPTVAAKLDVGTVLEGSVRRAGNRVRITAQLIDAQSDSHLWSDTYRRKAKALKWKTYMVFQRKFMLAIDRSEPQSLEELERIPGLGPAKLARFGDDILELVRAHGSRAGTSD